MTVKSLYSLGIAALLACSSLVAEAQYYSEPLVVLKDANGQVRPDSIANLETIRHKSTYTNGVRVWVTFTAPYDPNLVAGTREFKDQEKEIKKIREELVSRLQATAPVSRDYLYLTTGGPYFAVRTDTAGINFLVAEAQVIRIFGPV